MDRGQEERHSAAAPFAVALDESVVLPTVGDLTGRPPGTFEQWARAHASAFK